MEHNARPVEPVNVHVHVSLHDSHQRPVIVSHHEHLRWFMNHAKCLGSSTPSKVSRMSSEYAWVSAVVWLISPFIVENMCLYKSKRVKSRRAPQVESAQKEREQESQGTALEVSANYSAKLKRRRGLPN